jgi:hypothetical protein
LSNCMNSSAIATDENKNNIIIFFIMLPRLRQERRYRFA